MTFRGFNLGVGLRMAYQAIGKSLGWQQAMFGDILDGGSAGGNAELTRPYARSAWVHSAIKLVTGPISSRTIKFTRDKRGGDVTIDNPELTKFWETPGRACGGSINFSDFMEATAGWLKLKGQAFWIMDDTWLMPRGKKSPLILARPHEMHAIKQGKELIGWTWTNASGGREAILPEQVIHHKCWNPYDDVLGLADWESAMMAAESDYAAGTFAKNLAKNNGDRGPYVIGKGGVFTDDQIKQVTAQLRAKRDMGRRGDFRAAFLPADVEVKEPAINAVDAAYVTQRLENRKEVYIAFGVPPSFADPQASYSIGSASDMFRLIDSECIPLGKKISDGIEVVSARFLGGSGTVFAELDWSTHSTMQQVTAERFETATKAVDRGMPWKDAGEYFGLRLPRFKGDDVGRVPFNLTEIGGEDEEPPEGETTNVEEPDPVEELEKLFAARAQSCCSDHAPTPGGKPKAISAKALARWQQARKYREPWEKKFSGKVSRYLMDARAETLRNIAAAAGEQKAVTQKDFLDVLSVVFDLDAFLAKWTKGLLGISRAAMEQAGIEVWSDELGRDDPMTQPAAEVLAALKDRENKLAGAGTKVWEAIKADLETGIVKGETTDQLAERVRRKFQGIDKARSIAIAKTETTVAYETARDMAFRAAGVQWKQWLCSGLGNERLTHLAANEQIVAVDETFTVGGYAMKFPGDPEAPAKEVIACNCVSIAVGGPDEDDIDGNDGDAPY